MPTKPIVIVDLDNCIADDEWRIARIKWLHGNLFSRYHDYHLLSAFDALRNDYIFAHPGMVYMISTARPEHYRAMTSHWLRSKGVVFERLWMRPDDDHSPSTELKRRILAEIGPQSVACAYDDRPEVIKMYEANGVRGIKLAIHSTCAYTNPFKE